LNVLVAAAVLFGCADGISASLENRTLADAVQQPVLPIVTRLTKPGSDFR
jgi:hypothetical protein